jgi:hypothetical protein
MKITIDQIKIEKKNRKNDKKFKFDNFNRESIKFKKL